MPGGVNPVVDTNLSPNYSPGAGQTNPLEMVGQVAGIQNQLNQARAFQQTFAARQRLGEIAAGGAAAGMSEDDILHHAMGDPQVAGWGGDAVATLRQAALARQQLEGLKQEQSTSGLQVVLKSMGIAANDPNQLAPAIKAGLATLSPDARSRVTDASLALANSALAGVTKDPSGKYTPEGIQKYQDNMARLLMGSGVLNPSAAFGLTGRVERQAGAAGPYGPQGEQRIPMYGGLGQDAGAASAGGNGTPAGAGAG